MADGALGSVNALSETLTAAIPLVLAGLGIGLAFRAGLFNIGAEGQMVVGGLATAVASFSITGAADGDPSAAGADHRPVRWCPLCRHRRQLRAVTGAHEVISTIMLNLISPSGCSIISCVSPTSRRRAVRPDLARCAGKRRAAAASVLHRPQPAGLHFGLFIMLAAVGLVWWLLFRSKLGFAFRISGENPDTARYARSAPG